MSTELKKASAGLTFIGGILAFLIFGVLVLVWHSLSPKEESLDAKLAAARAEKLDLLQKDNHAKLSVYTWVNKDKGIVQLPIDRAMQLVAVELNAKGVKPSAVKVENPYPYGLQQVAAPAAAPAASGTAATSGTAAAPAPAATGSAAPAPGAPGTAVPQPASTPAPAK